MSVSENYLASIKKQFLYYKGIAEKAMDQLNEEQFFISTNEDTNSIANIVKHLHGNMLSRFTDFLTTDGEKESRNRDGEFANPEAYTDKDTLLSEWKKGWDCLFNTLDSLTVENLSDTIYIRGEGQTVIEAINRQLAHYPYHIGQIVFYAKQLKQSPWQSLSVPKNQSEEYNKIKFAEEKAKRDPSDLHK
ncbi:DUF1572 family protein [Flavobacterium cerinum]|uniref:DUF1572 domain-containing protein n=1 Tax=Flavobacterium cerinum TaxID=2502784 RepID=A0A444HB06_9FLAO|nr:DUF1572 family protein [Flavobacterium cerinum]RWX00488.1 DUF1572 domain-containing protein [Flavobacterium cerinum]